MVQASSAEPIVPSEKLPTSSPWDLAKLSEPPKFEWVDTKGPVQSLFYEGESFQGHSTRVFAYYASPTTLDPQSTSVQKYPGVVLLHGGGGTAYRDWAELWAKRGYAAIAMDLTGHQPVEDKNSSDPQSRRALSDGGPDQKEEFIFGNIDQPPTEQWTYHAVAAAIRAHSLLRSFPEVDTERTAVTGISWGGYLTVIVAGLDTRFQAAVPVYGCGHLQENSAWLQNFDKLTPAQRQRWAKLWDPSMYVAAIRMPILFINGTNDLAYPLDSYMKTYDGVTSPKQIRITINMPHSHIDGRAPAEIGWFVDQHLRGGHPLTVVGPVERTEQNITTKCQSKGKLTAQLNYTSDQGPFKDRKWHSVPAEVSDGKIMAKLPSQKLTAWFLTVTDDRNATVSSKVFFE